MWVGVGLLSLLMHIVNQLALDSDETDDVVGVLIGLRLSPATQQSEIFVEPCYVPCSFQRVRIILVLSLSVVACLMFLS